MPRGTNPNQSAEYYARLRSFGIPLLMALVAVGQMIVVEQQALTRWKGGGFGMYTEVHFKHREVWVVRRDGDRTLVHQAGIENPVVAKAAVKCKRWANSRCLSELAERVGWRNLVRLEVWARVVDPGTLEFSRRKLADYRPAARS